MTKIKLNLVSGTIIEKPLISAFNANGNSYVVLDNEMNGSMGLPIILVSKLENNKLIKIEDQNEWQLVKECLKNIIAGGQIEFISISSEIAADDIYYTQLTLPIPSFDVLKSAYKVEEVVSENTTPSTETEEVGVMDININQELPTVEETPVTSSEAPTIDQPVVANVEPVVEEPKVEVESTPVDENKPLIDINNNLEPSGDVTSVLADTVTPEEVAPTVDLNAETPIFNVNAPTSETASKTFEPEISPTPIIDAQIPTAPIDNTSIFKEQKEAFMQACENMFDALVQKFEKELENRK